MLIPGSSPAESGHETKEGDGRRPKRRSHTVACRFAGGSPEGSVRGTSSRLRFPKRVVSPSEPVLGVEAEESCPNMNGVRSSLQSCCRSDSERCACPSQKRTLEVEKTEDKYSSGCWEKAMVESIYRGEVQSDQIQGCCKAVKGYLPALGE